MKNEVKNYQRLFDEMECHGLNKRKLAIRANIIPTHLYAALNGRTEFWHGWKVKIADALGVNVDDLFDDEDGE